MSSVTGPRFKELKAKGKAAVAAAKAGDKAGANAAVKEVNQSRTTRAICPA